MDQHEDPRCAAFRSEALDALAAGASVAGPSAAAESNAHALECAACARFAARAMPIRRALAALPRRDAPRELDGRVVAELGAGVRQERAVAAVRALGRVAPPAELDSAVGGEARAAADTQSTGRPAAPRVLERLVAEELADPAKATVRRFVGSLRRVRAPRELSAAVARDLAAHGSRASFSRSRTRKVYRLAAAAVVAAIAVPITLWSLATRETRRPFRVEYVRSLEGLDPIARGWLDAASGGAAGTRDI